MNLGLASGLPVANRLAKVKAINPERQSRVYVADASADGSLRTNRALLVAHGPPRTRVPEGRSKIGRRFSAGFLRFQIDPVPEGRGERCGQKMIRVAALFCDGAKVWPEPCSYRRSQPRFAVLCAENIMDQNRAKGVGHCETYTITEITTCKYVLIITTPSPRPCGTGSILVYWNTGAEAPAYYQSASPRRRNVGRASSPVASPK